MTGRRDRTEEPQVVCIEETAPVHDRIDNRFADVHSANVVTHCRSIREPLLTNARTAFGFLLSCTRLVVLGRVHLLERLNRRHRGYEKDGNESDEAMMRRYNRVGRGDDAALQPLLFAFLSARSS